MFGLGKKKDKNAPSQAGQAVPSDRVSALSSQGYSEPEIIKTLRQEGYSPLAVDRALKQALRSGSTGQQNQAPVQQAPQSTAPQQPAAPQQQGNPFGPPPGPDQTNQQQSPPGEPPMPQFDPPPAGDKFAPRMWDTGRGGFGDDDDDLDMDDLPEDKQIGPDQVMKKIDRKTPPLPPAPGESDDDPLPFRKAPLPKGGEDRSRELKDRKRREIEELAEQIVEEKWRDVTRRISGLEERLETVAAEAKSAASNPQSGGGSQAELDAIRKEISRQKQTAEETNARIDSLEEVVKESLSPMLESVRKFTHAVKNKPQEPAPPAPSTVPPQAPSAAAPPQQGMPTKE